MFRGDVGGCFDCFAVQRVAGRASETTETIGPLRYIALKHRLLTSALGGELGGGRCLLPRLVERGLHRHSSSNQRRCSHGVHALSAAVRWPLPPRSSSSMTSSIYARRSRSTWRGTVFACAPQWMARRWPPGC